MGLDDQYLRECHLLYFYKRLMETDPFNEHTD